MITILIFKDDGCYDAFNKGIRKSSGDIIGFLHSDDLYSDKIIEEYCKNIGEAPGIYGDLIYVDSNNTNKKSGIGNLGNKKNFYYGWMPAHPTLYLRKEIYEKYGFYRLDCGTGADYSSLLEYYLKII